MIVYFYESQGWVNQPDRLAAGNEVLLNFFARVLSKIAGRDDLNGQRGSRVNRTVVEIEVLHSLRGDKGNVGLADHVSG